MSDVHPLTKAFLAGVLLGGGTLAVYLRRIRPWHLRWNATDEELRASMPADDEVERPQYDATWAVTIDAPPEAVWPWLVQMGQGRGGFYSYDWIENLMGMAIHSSDELLPEFQSLQPGDVIPAGPGPGIAVKAVDPGRSLVLGTPPEAESEVHATWSTVLRPLPGDRTRFVSRNRFRFARWTPHSLALYAMLDPGIFVMVRKWMLGIKARAEALHARSVAAAARAESLH